VQQFRRACIPSLFIEHHHGTRFASEPLLCLAQATATSNVIYRDDSGLQNLDPLKCHHNGRFGKSLIWHSCSTGSTDAVWAHCKSRFGTGFKIRGRSQVPASLVLSFLYSPISHMPRHPSQPFVNESSAEPLYYNFQFVKSSS
jgi:hypothetical protein